ncbi:uncharacterized protein LY79DRAFT_667851 [Colletotrichum navitas]|uniref:Cell wall protein n=1 Tax=Colletotrichum navitas TaxID=681940 RepID=A0AAD8Q409_9PEZI|nr:uncharacterized protein LY79DRAFT_667851 [Colletotrichum navitas]KAK1595440.1 hypothetical protein LY79DRAFT_667851 [Colletotrichum navitas]
MQAKFIIAAIGAATAAIANPVPGVIDHAICNKLLNNIIDNLKTAIADVALANSGSPPANAAILLEGVKDTVDNNWERRNKLTLGIKSAELVTATATIVSVQEALNGTDPSSVLAQQDVALVKGQFDQISFTCQIDQ